MDYAKKLKDPRWQKKRLEALSRAGWKCQHCGSETKTLNVHHGYYEKGKDPWDYHLATLHVLCDACHKEAHARLDALKFQLGMLSVHELGYLSDILLLNHEGVLPVIRKDRLLAWLAIVIDHVGKNHISDLRDSGVTFFSSARESCQ